MRAKFSRIYNLPVGNSLHSNAGRESRIKINREGFTLIETLVSILIVATLGIIITMSLSNLLNGSAKTEAIKDVKQNGDYALSSMEQNIRNAVNVYNQNGSNQVCNGSYSSITVVQPAKTINYTCDSSTDRISVVIDAGAINYLTGNTVSVSSADCLAMFTCSKDDSGYKTISIKFDLQSKSFPTVIQTYQTQVKLRNKP